jgi:hypothetical protein
MQQDQFWMVWVNDGNAPVCTHPSRESAEKEAARLARLLKRRVHVLEQINAVEVPDLVWHFPPSSEIPF